jgi:glutamate--cysteine ligase
VTPLTERAAERLVAARALVPAYPGLVGLALDLPVAAPGPAGPTRLPHGFLSVRADRAVVSGPPSPGLEVALDRMGEDLEAAAAVLTGDRTAPTGLGVRVSLEAGTDDDSPTGLRRRWAVAHAVAPVLTAAFANRPAADGTRTTRRLPVPADDETDPAGLEADPRLAWARQALDAPVLDLAPLTFRQWIRRGQGSRPTIADLDRHLRAFRPPVSARGHLEIDVADHQPENGWVVPAAVITTLVDDPRAAAEALLATTGLPATSQLWQRATRDALTDPELATAARSLFLSAYAALARRGAPRPVRDAVAAYFERFVVRGRCPADDLLDLRRPAENRP